MTKIILPADSDAIKAIRAALPGFDISNLANPVPGRVWTADVKTAHTAARIYAKFSQRSGWFIDNRA